MQTSESIDKLMPAIIKAQQSIAGSVGKSGFNQYDKYRYAKLEDYVVATRETLLSHGLTIIVSTPEVVSLPTRKTSKGNDENAVMVRMVLRLCHDSGQWIEVEQWGEGQDRGDKGTYKAVTGARKYGYANLLGLFTSDDPEDEGGGKRSDNGGGRSAASNDDAAPQRSASELI